MSKICPLMSHWIGDDGYTKATFKKTLCIESDCALWSITLNGCALNNGVVNLVKPNPTETYRV